MAIWNAIESVLIVSDIMAHKEQQKCPDERNEISRIRTDDFERISGQSHCLNDGS
jgi:hypothetical protein